MPSRIINDITVVYETAEADTVESIAETIVKALPIIYESWGLSKPKSCFIYVMTSWFWFFFRSAPLYWQIVLALSFPLWASRARRMWPYSGAWTQRYGRQVAIGIKPPRLLEVSDKSIGKRLFEEEKDPRIKICHLTCHELTHACSAHLRLPAWLNEGIAAVTVDRYLHKRTIRRDTLNLLCNFKAKGSPPTYAKLSRSDPEAIAYHAALGYWLVQYLEEVYPGTLKELFVSSRKNLLKEIASKLGIDVDSFWSKIPETIYTYFNENVSTAGEG